MRGAYNDIMEHISVTEEMRARILTNLQKADTWGETKTPRFSSRRWLAAAACVALLLAGAITLPHFRTPARQDPLPGVQGGILNRVQAGSLEELSQTVGFEVEGLANLPFEVTEIRYTAYNGELAEVSYIGEAQSLVFRQVRGNTDPSGDYTAYSSTLVLELGHRSVTLKGEADGYRLAVWQDDGCSCSVSSSAAYPQDQWMELLPAEG